MILYVKNKMMSLGGGSYVVDEAGEKVFCVKGKVFSFTSKKMIYDMQGKLLFSVKNKVWNWFRRSVYIYNHQNGKEELLCRIKAPIMASWKVEDNHINLDLRGRLFDGTYVSIAGKPIGKFHLKRSLAALLIRDAYKVHVEEVEYAAFLVALAVGYDNIRDQRKN